MSPDQGTTPARRTRLLQIPIGTRYGSYVTVSEVFTRKNPITGRVRSFVKVQCDCGSQVREADTSNLKRRAQKPPACDECARVKQIPVGSRFGRLVTIGQVFREINHGKPNRVLVRVRCDCGKDEHIVEAAHLRSGNTKSCGCLQREAVTTHGLSKKFPKLYRCWYNMHRRCSTPTTHNYSSYGGKGIAVCDEWQDFPAFLEWALANGYQDGLQLDRIDPDSNYGPDNCRWLSSRENIARAGRLLESDDVEERLARYVQMTGKARETVIYEALHLYIKTQLTDADAEE